MITAPISSLIAIETFPGPATVADVDIDYYIAHNSGTEYHPTGTNSILPLSLGGVVNTSLVVYGTTNLRVVDVSVVPLSVSSHTEMPVPSIPTHPSTGPPPGKTAVVQGWKYRDFYITCTSTVQCRI
ncbi:hypothetical protein B0H14DRAFT_2612275 [Mycena olivaceomarginata]|nr:hypothetical protein B0H14DRAFT_2612275 [Mycena olivaceomarginata]